MSHSSPGGHVITSQHTPSTQLFDRHCSGLRHGVPFALGPLQVPVLQNCPSGHIATAQQNPSTQKPERHCAGSEHGAPFSPGPSH
jgi:hypothetical protein